MFCLSVCLYAPREGSARKRASGLVELELQGTVLLLLLLLLAESACLFCLQGAEQAALAQTLCYQLPSYPEALPCAKRFLITPQHR